MARQNNHDDLQGGDLQSELIFKPLEIHPLERPLSRLGPGLESEQLITYPYVRDFPSDTLEYKTPVYSEIEEPEKPIGCRFCEAEFTGDYQKGNLKRHEKSRHSEEILKLRKTSDNRINFQCSVCYVGFKRVDSRREHEWRTHSLESARPFKESSKKTIFPRTTNHGYR